MWIWRPPDDGGICMVANRTLAGLLALATIVLAVAGEALVLAHVAGALGLIMLACGAAAGVVGWIALGAPRKRDDIST
jgi:hypothetical protein